MLIFSEAEGFSLQNNGNGQFLVKQIVNIASIWREYNLQADGGLIGSLTTISPESVDNLTFSAGNNIILSFDQTSNNIFKIEVNNELSGLTGVTIDGENGLKVKNGSNGAGFIEFYENSNNGTR